MLTNDSSAPDDIAYRVRAEQIKAQYASMPASFMGSVFSSGTYLLVAHTVLPTWQWVLWGALMLAQALGRGLLWRAYRQCSPGIEQTDRWARRALAGSAISGCIWGLGAWLVFPSDHIEYQLFFMFLVASMGSLSAIASASYLPAFYAYTMPTILPIAVSLVFEDGLMLKILGVISLGYLPVISTFAHNLGRSVIESFRLRFENLDLLREVIERKEQVEDASREKSMFLASASHDLRQPLHALALQAHLLSKTTLAPDQQHLVSGMRSSIESMTGLFDSLLDMSRLDAGVLPVRWGTVELQCLFGRVESEFRPEAAARGIDLRFRATDLVVRSDDHLLGSLIGNLVSNAIRYTRSGGVLVAARRRAGGMCVQVWDTGCGIAQQDQRVIFKPFHQLGNVERDRTKGLGLGLAIVDRLSRLLGTELTVRSRVDRGSCFSVFVPNAITRPTELASRVNERSPDPRQSVDGAVVIVVDNELEIRAVMASLLESWGCQVVSAGSSAEALARAGAMHNAPHLLLSDYRLGAEATGLQLIERLRDEFNQAIPALIVTGDTGAQVLREVEAADCTILHKPVSATVLQQAVERMLAGRQT
jgi:signal transduction histidine kinase/CheY-like chemotaxis protein